MLSLLEPVLLSPRICVVLSCLSPTERLSIDFRDPLRREIRIDYRRDIFVRLIDGPRRPLHNPLAVRHQQPEFNLRSAAEPLLARAVFHLEWEAELVKARVHCLVQDRRGDFGIREIRIDRKGQFYQTSPLLVKVGPTARESLNDDIGKVPFEAAEMVGDVTLD